MTSEKNMLRVIPKQGKKITFENGELKIPENPIIPFIEGDGIGPDIWRASVQVFDSAVEKAYQGKRKILRQFDPIVVGKKGLSPDTAEFLSVFFQQRKTPGQRIPQKLVFLSLMLQANSVTQPATAVGFQYRPVSPQLDAARIFRIIDDVECVSIVADKGLENFSRISIVQINPSLFHIPFGHNEDVTVFLDRLQL